MIEFTRITSEDLYEKTSTLRQYFNAQQTNFSDFSCGFTFMWKDYSKMCYCITRSCLVIKQDYENGKVGFTYPCSLTGNIEDEKLALRDIEEYAMSERYKLLRYCVVSEQQKTALLEHYKDQVSITNDRIWQDYLYLSESFKTYSGKKLSGQRNHVNKFISTYPNYLVKEYKAEDEERLRLFEKEFEEQYSFSERGLAKTELLETKKFSSRSQLDNYVNNLDNFYDMSGSDEIYKNNRGNLG
ncbi:MAG: phosphatidylglycerol lysyltransferase domain-containing protein, partial [Clostridia bacterium]